MSRLKYPDESGIYKELSVAAISDDNGNVITPSKIGNLSNLSTSEKSNLTGAISEVKNEVITHKAESMHIGNNPSCRVYHNVNQSVENNTTTFLAFNSERFDNDNIHDVTTNNTRLTCKTKGKYLICGNVRFNANANGTRQLGIFKNRSMYLGYISVSAMPSGNQYLQIVNIADLDVGDYIELLVIQNSGSSLTIATESGISPEFSMVRVG